MQYSSAPQPSGILERLTPPTLRAMYLFWLMQVTQGEVSPDFLNDVLLAGGGMLQRATLNAMELETLLNVQVMMGRARHIANHHRLHPVHGAVLRSLGQAERLLQRRSIEDGSVHRYQRVGGIGYVTAKVEPRGRTQFPR